jgi:hypothetical protein
MSAKGNKTSAAIESPLIDFRDIVSHQRFLEDVRVVRSRHLTLVPRRYLCQLPARRLCHPHGKLGHLIKISSVRSMIGM